MRNFRNTCVTDSDAFTLCTHYAIPLRILCRHYAVITVITHFRCASLCIHYACSLVLRRNYAITFKLRSFTHSSFYYASLRNSITHHHAMTGPLITRRRALITRRPAYHSPARAHHSPPHARYSPAAGRSSLAAAAAESPARNKEICYICLLKIPSSSRLCPSSMRLRSFSFSPFQPKVD